LQDRQFPSEDSQVAHLIKQGLQVLASKKYASMPKKIKFWIFFFFLQEVQIVNVVHVAHIVGQGGQAWEFVS